MCVCVCVCVRARAVGGPPSLSLTVTPFYVLKMGTVRRLRKVIDLQIAMAEGEYCTATSPLDSSVLSVTVNNLT